MTRLASQNRSSEIERMIANENDPARRANLIVLNSINNSIVTTVGLAQDMTERLETHIVNFDAHTKKEEKIYNTGRGMWLVLSVVLMTAQAMGTYFFVRLNDNINAISDSIAALQKSDIRLEGRLFNIERSASIEGPK